MINIDTALSVIIDYLGRLRMTPYLLISRLSRIDIRINHPILPTKQNVIYGGLWLLKESAFRSITYPQRSVIVIMNKSTDEGIINFHPLRGY